MTDPLEVRLATPEDMSAAYALRYEVFVVGQGVPESLERDEDDGRSDHVVALRSGRVVGTGRLLLEGPPGSAGLVGRLAVAAPERHQGVGAAVLSRLEQQAATRRAAGVDLHAQVHARRFYERRGYVAHGEVYLEAGIDHIGMSKPLDD